VTGPIGHDGVVNRRQGSSTLLAFSGLCVAVFSISLGVLVSSQLALMSVLDQERAERAAEQIATSRFTAGVIEQTVQRAVAPIAGDDIAAQLAVATSADPRVTDVVSSSLISAHRQIVDAEPTSDPGSGADDGNVAIRTAIAQSVLDTATAAGFDPASLGIDPTDAASLPLDAVAEQEGLASLVPTDVPSLGLRQVAETTRVIAAIAMVIFGIVAVLAHPRSARGLRRLGVVGAVICGVWLVGLLVTGWVIGLFANTLFGEMLQTVWTDAVASMMLLVGAGVLIGAGVAIAGMAFDGWARARSQRRAW
jgi:hypothetical protein